MLFEKPRTMLVESKHYWVERTNKECTHNLIINTHYAHRLPPISYAWALLSNEGMEGVITFGPPATPKLCDGICGKEHRHLVIELNRLVLRNNKPNLASFLVGTALRQMPPRVVVSYADTDQSHLGIVYQATNFLFTGTTKARTDAAAKNGNHSRHGIVETGIRVHRSPKHRYVYFTGDKQFQKTMKAELKYDILPYPKKMVSDEPH